jgi:hypothetical protein
LFSVTTAEYAFAFVQLRAMFKQAANSRPNKTGLRRINLDGTEEDLPFGWPPSYPPGYWAAEEAAYYAKYPKQCVPHG